MLEICKSAIGSMGRSSGFFGSIARHLLGIVIFAAGAFASGQEIGWAWLSGAAAPRMVMNVGSVGVPSPDSFPGSRRGATTWVGQDGNLWLFGGDLGYSQSAFDETNDLWMYDRSLNQWVCQSAGTPIPLGNYTGASGPGGELHPGARSSAMSWAGDDGGVWLFGGYGFDKSGPQGRLNDLWNYNSATKTWSWIKGADTTNVSPTYGTKGVGAPNNTPGALSDAFTWKDSSGNLWLFGGSGYFGGSVRLAGDVWKFDVAAGNWTWMHGPGAGGSPAVTGTQGVAAAGNTPGGLTGFQGWVDGSDVWIYGGYAADDLYPRGDLWKYSVSTNQWTWMKGDNTENPEPVYGVKGVADGLYHPGARTGSVTWKDSAGNLWLYGGETAYDDPNNSYQETGAAGDWWKLDRATLQWAWMGGAKVGENVIAVYGIKGVSAEENGPGTRLYGTFWNDGAGNLWGWGGRVLYNNDSLYTQEMWRFDSTAHRWAWMSGDVTTPASGVYGTRGTPASSNSPGARVEPVALTTPDQKMWLMGGMGVDVNGEVGFLNDLWSYDPVSMRWTWVKGYDTANHDGWYGSVGQTHSAYTPGGRRNASGWVDHEGNIWIFGGETYRSLPNDRWDDILRNDLWRFDVSTGNWTWMSGGRLNQDRAVFGDKGVFHPDNVPGAREGACTWVDSDGNLWLFGGWGTTDENTIPSPLNDLWKFDVSLNQWAWMHGTKLKSERGVYGTQGLTASGNMPGARENAVSWTDAEGNFWLFGGYGYGESSYIDPLNDMWKFEPAVGQWTWMHGPKMGEQGASYGVMGVADSTNVPGARFNSVGMTMPGGLLGMFGGEGLVESVSFERKLSDLWLFNTATNQWTWAGGSNEQEVLPVYGAPFEITSSTTPGGRFKGAAWGLSDGSVWYFGGDGVVQNPQNDLWRLGVAPAIPSSATDWQLFE